MRAYFFNRGRDKIKTLYWERNSFCLWQKRLEKDRFKWPKASGDHTITLN
jgi:transposase